MTDKITGETDHTVKSNTQVLSSGNMSTQYNRSDYLEHLLFLPFNQSHTIKGIYSKIIEVKVDH